MPAFHGLAARRDIILFSPARRWPPSLRSTQLLLAASAWVLMACSSPSTSADTLTGKLVVGGSGSVYPALQPMTRAFSSRHPGVTFDYGPSSQAATAIAEGLAGKLDIGLAGRPLEPGERRPGLREIPIAIDGIVLAVHRGLQIEELSTEQVRSIYSGKVSWWSQLGGPQLRIVAIDRTEDETAKIALRRFLLGQELQVRPDAAVVAKESDMIQAVEGVEGAIGFFTLSYFLEGNSKITALTIDGVAPTFDNLLNGSYRLVRPVNLLVGESAAGRSPLREFLKFAQSAEAVAALEGAGFVRPR